MGVEITPGRFAAPHRGGHLQDAGGDLGVVVLAMAKPGTRPLATSSTAAR